MVKRHQMLPCPLLSIEHPHSEPRKIIHVDMDAFFASVEQHDNPDLRGKAIAVGGSRERGVVAAASYEARKFGVRSAMPSITAARNCPHLIFVRPRFERYKEVSEQIHEVFHRYTDLVEPLSLDEAYLDVTHNKKDLRSATLIAEEIRREIKAETGLTASAGISINKFLAKVASDIHKPDGLTLIKPQDVAVFIAALPIRKFYGVGKVTAEKLDKMGIKTGADMQRFTLSEMIQKFGKSGRYYFNICRGIDDRPVKPDRQRKSIGAENTFRLDLETIPQMMDAIGSIIHSVGKRIARSEAKGKTVTLKIKYFDFEQQTRSKTVSQWLSKEEELIPLVHELLHQKEVEKPVRLLGVSLSNLHQEPEIVPGTQLTLEF